MHQFQAGVVVLIVLALPSKLAKQSAGSGQAVLATISRVSVPSVAVPGKLSWFDRSSCRDGLPR